MKTKTKTFLRFIVLLIAFLFSCGNSIQAQSGWQLIYQGPVAGYGIHSLHFTDASTGYGTYWGGIIKTTNAGANWVTIGPFSDLGHRFVFFINANTGFIAGAGISADTGEVFKTTNAGVNWTTCTLPFKRHFTTVHFLDQNTGYVSGYGVIMKTTNAGSTWEAYYLYNNAYYFAIVFTDANTGFVVGNSGRIYKTTNGGGFWQQLNSGTSIHLWGLSFANATTGCAVGGLSNDTEDIIMRTTDAGSSWTQVSYYVYNSLLWTIRFVNQSTGFIQGGQGNILKSTNSGLTWYKQQCTNFSIARALYFINPNTGYASGYLDTAGFVFKTTTGGEPLGIKPISNEIPERFSLSQNYPNPFNPVTKITFALPKSGDVKLTLYDLLGREVTTLVNEKLSPGTYEVDFDGINYPSGVYFYRFTAGEFTDTKKMILIK